MKSSHCCGNSAVFCIRTKRGHAHTAADVIIPAFSSKPCTIPSTLPLSTARNSGLGKAAGGRGGGMACFPTNAHTQTAIYLSQPSMAVS